MVVVDFDFVFDDWDVWVFGIVVDGEDCVFDGDEVFFCWDVEWVWVLFWCFDDDVVVMYVNLMIGMLVGDFEWGVFVDFDEWFVGEVYDGVVVFGGVYFFVVVDLVIWL